MSASLLVLVIGSCASSDTPLQIDQTAWMLAEQRIGTELIPLVDGTAVTLSFDVSSGSVFGFSGCQRYIFAATVGSDTIAVEYSGHDDVGCPPGGGDQQKSFFTNLRRAARYTVADHELILVDSSEEVVAVFSQDVYQPFSEGTDITAQS